jgi:SAM-dependent methyltransferase
MTSNGYEADAWNGARGQAWVRDQVVMDALLSPILDLTITSARLSPGEAVLDIGCGSGATTQAAARAVGPQGRAVGLDISAPLLDQARSLAAQMGNVAFLRADAQTHPFAPEFDVLISRFGVMFFDDPTAAFANMARALRPGGRVSVVAWASLDLNPFFNLPLRTAECWLGPADPIGDGPGPMAFANSARVEGVLRAAGLVDVTANPTETWLTPLGTLDDVAQLLLDSGPASRLIATKTPSAGDLAEIRRACHEAMGTFVTGAGVRIPACVNLFQARRPG